MSYPADNMQAFIRNPIWEVRSWLDYKHSSHYKVYNLCCESQYKAEHFHGRVEQIPFDDNYVPPLSLVKIFCESVQRWLDEHPSNVAVVHCRAGKGRTGLMVSAYLVYKGMGSESALELYGAKRAWDNQGVTIASQRRYVGYWSKVLVFPSEDRSSCLPEVHLPPAKTRELRRIRLYDTINTDCVEFKIQQVTEVSEGVCLQPQEVAKGFCKPLEQGFQNTVGPLYYWSYLSREGDEMNGKDNGRLVGQMDTERPISISKACLDHYFEKPLAMAGDVRATFLDKSGTRLFYACFNTFFIANSIIQLVLKDLDKVGKQAKAMCGPGFCLELLFGPAEPHVPETVSKPEDSL